MMLDTQSLYLIGAGGHARVVYDALQRTGFTGKVQISDDNPGLTGKTFYNLPISVPAIPSCLNQGDNVHVAIGNNLIRAEIAASAVKAGASLVNIVHPDASVAAAGRFAPGCFIAAQSVLAPGASLGAACIINHGAVVDHDCIIGDFVHIAPRAVLGGGVQVGSGSLIGAGAVILPSRKIGVNAVVGAGAVVVNDVPDGARWVGVPALPMK